MDDDALLEGAVTSGGGHSPDVHPHAAVAAIGGSGKVGVVGARAILGIQDDKVIAQTTLAVVVGLEVAGNLVEAEEVQQVVVLVGSVEQLGDGGITVVRGVGLGQREGVLKGPGCAGWAVVVEVVVASVGVDLGNGVVTACGGVVGGSVAKPGEGRGIDSPRISEGLAVTLRGVVEAPGEHLDGGKVADVVDDTVDLLVGGSVDVGEQPVVDDVGLDSPGQGQSSVLLGKVDQAGLGVADSTRSALESVLLSSLLGLGGGAIGLDGETQDVDGTLERIRGVGEVTLLQGALCGQLAGEEAVAVREDSAISANLEQGIGKLLSSWTRGGGSHSSHLR